MEHRIEPKESWLLAPWHRKTTYEKLVLSLGLIIGVDQTIELYETGSAFDWFLISGYWVSWGWAYFSRSRSREIIVITELKLSAPYSVQAERRLSALK